MDILTEIQNWLEEFKTKYKPIEISPPPKDYRDIEGFMSDLLEYQYYRGDRSEDAVSLNIAVRSIEEFAILVHYLKRQDGVRILEDGEFEFDRYYPNPVMITYETPTEFYDDYSYSGLIDCTELSLRVDRNHFSEFWKNFWNDFILPCKYLLSTSQFWFHRQELTRI